MSVGARTEPKIVAYATIILCNYGNKALTADSFYSNAEDMPKAKQIEKINFSKILNIRKDFFEDGIKEGAYKTWRLKKEIYENLDKEKVINYDPENLSGVLEELYKAAELANA